MDWFNELIGLFIVLFVFLFPVLRKMLIGKAKQQEPEEEENYFEEEEKPAPSTPQISKRTVRQDFDFHAQIDERQFESKIDELQLETHIHPNMTRRVVSESFTLKSVDGKRPRKNPIHHLFQTRPPLQAMMIFKELLGDPKGDRLE